MCRHDSTTDRVQTVSNGSGGGEQRSSSIGSLDTSTSSEAPAPAAGFLPPTPNLGEKVPEQTVSSLIDHFDVNIGGDLRKVLQGEHDYYVWSGRVFDAASKTDRAGRFWIPALYRSADLDIVVNTVEQSSRDRDHAIGRVQTYGRGLGDRLVAYSFCAYAEIDHLTFDEQIERYRALAEATGLHWSLILHSGGKSAHAYLVFDRVLPASSTLREQIQRLLIVTLGADTAIVNPGRKMRLPGYVGGDRQQPVLHLDASAKHDPFFIRDRLAVYAESLGISDVDTAFTALRMAEAAEGHARTANANGDAEGAAEHAARAAELRSKRGQCTQAELEKIGRMSGGGGAAYSGQLERKGAIASDTVVATAGGGSATLGALGSALGAGAYVACYCPHHGDPSPGASLRRGREGTLRLTCFSDCKATWIVSDPLPEDAEIVDVGAVLDGDGDVAEPEDEVDNKERLLDLAILEIRRQHVAESEAELAIVHQFRARHADQVAQVEDKKALASQVRPEVSEMAQGVMRLAKQLMPMARAHYRAMGIAPDAPRCGVPLGMGHTGNGAMGIIAVRCKSPSCAYCGPWRLACQTASLIGMPLLEAGEGSAYLVEGEEVQGWGLPLGTRALWAWDMRLAQVRSWQRRFERQKDVSIRNPLDLIDENTAFVANRTKDIPILSPISDIFALFANHSQHLGIPHISTDGWLILDRGHGTKATGKRMVSVIATRPSAPPGIRPIPVSVDGAAETIMTRVLETYSRHTSSGRITGQIRTSRSVISDVRGVRRIAYPSEWTVEEKHVMPASAAAQAWAEAGEHVSVEGDRKTPSAVIVPSVFDAKKRQSNWALVQPGDAVDMTIWADSELDAALDSLLDVAIEEELELFNTEMPPTEAIMEAQDIGLPQLQPGEAWGSFWLWFTPDWRVGTVLHIARTLGLDPWEVHQRVVDISDTQCGILVHYIYDIHDPRDAVWQEAARWRCEPDAILAGSTWWMSAEEAVELAA